MIAGRDANLPRHDATSRATRAFEALSIAAMALPTNQVRQWARRPTPPRVVAWLQRAGQIPGRAHHAADAEGVDVNFAVHLQVLDRIFGTFHLPRGRWPEAYGLANGERVPSGYLAQLVEPFRSKVRSKES